MAGTKSAHNHEEQMRFHLSAVHSNYCSIFLKEKGPYKVFISFNFKFCWYFDFCQYKININKQKKANIKNNYVWLGTF